MEKPKLIQFGIALVIGIIIGLLISFALWHGTPDTCTVPLNC